MTSSNINIKANMSSSTQPLTSESFLNSKIIAFMSIMSVLGVVLAFLSIYSLPIGPGIAVDLSHVGTYIVALSGGPIMGTIAGAIVGIIPSLRFANPALIPGKMLTGFSVGFLYLLINKIDVFKRNEKMKIVVMIFSGIIGYIPEMVFTIWDLNIVMGFDESIIIGILIKAWIEIIIISILMSVILSIKSVSNLISDLIGEQGQIRRLEILMFAAIIDASMLMFMIIFLPFEDPKSQWGWHYLSQTELEYFMWMIGLAIILAGLIAYIVYNLKFKKTTNILG